jgi:hypothetical protein
LGAVRRKSFCQGLTGGPFRRGQLKISFQSFRESHLDAFPTGGINMPSGSGKRGFIGGAVVSLVITALLSLGAIYGLNRYLGPIDDPPQTTGSLRHSPTK